MMTAASVVVLYTPKGSPRPSWAPAIKSYPKDLTPGKTYKITGTQFNGLSQAMSYGDEDQNPTNYPLVRITNKASGRVYYLRTHDHSTMGVCHWVETRLDALRRSPWHRFGYRQARGRRKWHRVEACQRHSFGKSRRSAGWLKQNDASHFLNG